MYGGGGDRRGLRADGDLLYNFRAAVAGLEELVSYLTKGLAFAWLAGGDVSAR